MYGCAAGELAGRAPTSLWKNSPGKLLRFLLLFPSAFAASHRPCCRSEQLDQLSISGPLLSSWMIGPSACPVAAASEPVPAYFPTSVTGNGDAVREIQSIWSL